MRDVAARKGLRYDIPKLETYFGAPAVQTVGCRSDGVRSLLEKLAGILENGHGRRSEPMLSFGTDIEDAIAAVSGRIDALRLGKYAHIPSRFFAIKLLEHDSAVMRMASLLHCSSRSCSGVPGVTLFP